MLPCLGSMAQVGEHRDVWAVGVTGGYNLNTISFLPKVPQDMHTGISAGLMARYTCEKYFSTICSVQAEVNYSQLGWKEKILSLKDEPVPVSPTDPTPQEYKRTLNYIQVPIMAHLAWGRETRGFNFFFNAGPQFGILCSEVTKTNILGSDGKVISSLADRTSNVIAQDTMAVENKFDYGITAGLGVEAHIRHIGRIQVEGRYYYGLGNIYGDSKRDYFAASNHSTISIKVAYLMDL